MSTVTRQRAVVDLLINAEVAHLVEHDLAKVGVAGSSPVFRSDRKGVSFSRLFLYRLPGWRNW